MSLAKVVHNLSTDHDFATQWKVDPEGTLEKRGPLYLWAPNSPFLNRN